MATSSIFAPGASERFSFSPNLQDWALTTHDGRMAIWDSETGKIKQEFLPSAHLSSACTCLAWIPINEQESKKKKSRKRKSSITLTNGTNGFSGDDAPQRSDLIAVGTSSGAVLIYSLKTGDVSSFFSTDKAHTDRINDITWNHACTEIFTASSDGLVGKFNVKKSTVLAKFKWEDGPKTEPAHSVCVHPSDRSLLIGSPAKITWWDLDAKTPLKTLVGAHLGPVSVMSIAMLSPDVCYLVTAGSSEQDHTLAMWNLVLDKSSSSEGSQDSIVARFGANEPVKSVSISTAGEEVMSVTAVTRSGTLLCFDHSLTKKSKSGRKKKPVKPRSTVQIATEKDKSGKVNPIPILDARIGGDMDNLSIRIVHGENIRPVFETLMYDQLDSLTCLVRQFATATHAQHLGAGSSNLMVPKSSGTHILAPGPSMMVTPGRKRKQSIGDKTESLAMVDRLRLLSREGESAATPPRADSMLQLLLQGLNNKDRKIINTVLDRADEELIEKTVRKLPVDSVLDLIVELQHYIKGRGVVNQSHSKWLRCVLQIHTAYLISSPECQQLLGPIYAMLEARTKHYASLLQLKGKLDMMTRQIVSNPDEDVWPEPSKEALLVYQDDSSDELSEVLDDLLLPASDTEDIWNQEHSEGEEASDDEGQNVEQIEISDESDEDEVMVNGNGNGNGDAEDSSMESE